MGKYPEIRALLCGVLLASAARGQTPEAKAQAEALFEDGVKKLEAKQYPEACQALEASLRLDHGTGTLLYLADCHEQVGKLASAWSAFREAASLSRAAGQAEREAVALRRAAALEPRMSRLTLLVPTPAPPGLRVVRNGHDVPRETWGISLPVDAGPSVIEVSAPGKLAARHELSVASGEQRTFEVAPLAEAPKAEVTAAPAAPIAPAPRVEERSSSLRLAGGLLAGAGLLGAGAGAYLAVRASNRSDEADRLCDPAQRTRCSSAGVRLGNDARSTANLATVALSVGATMIASGALLYLLAPPGPRRQGATLYPTFARNEAQLALGGAW